MSLIWIIYWVFVFVVLVSLIYCLILEFLDKASKKPFNKKKDLDRGKPYK